MRCDTCKNDRRMCKECTYRHNREYREKNKEKLRKYDADRFKNNPSRRAWTSSKKAAQKKWRQSEAGIAWQERYRIKRKEHNWGIDYFKMLSEQKGVCAACGSSDPGNSGSKDVDPNFYVDHCHVTGKIRGLLCSPCNLAIGHAKDNPDTLRLCAAYLERTK